MRPGTLLPLLALLIACGEFHTYKYYRDASDDGQSRASCDTWQQVQLSAMAEATIAFYQPTWIPIAERRLDGSVPLSFELVAGVLPAGLYLNSDTGTISGFPQESGSYQVVIGAFANPALSPCVLGDEVVLTVHVEAPCQTEDECLVQVLMGQQMPRCEEPGYCLSDAPGGLCPGALGAPLQYDLSQFSSASFGRPITVMSHHPLTKEAQSVPGRAGYSHEMLLDADDDTPLSFAYRLAHSWPLPYAPGETVQFDVDPLVPGLLTVKGLADDRRTYLFDGPLPPTLTSQQTAIPFDVQRAALDCPVPEDSHQCGPRNHDLLLVSAPPSPSFGAPSGAVMAMDLAGRPYELAVASAYSHLPAQFSCPNIASSWASFEFMPLDSCPVAQVSKGAGAPVLWSANDVIPVILDGTGSMGHMGATVDIYEWRLVRQPYAGLVDLSEPGAGKGPSNGWFALLPATAVGTYDVELQVVDSHGVPSCAAALAQVVAQVPPDVDLRLELVWWTEDDQLASEAEFHLLLMHPTYAKVLGGPPWDSDAWSGSNAQKWVCSTDNPVPANWAALPGGDMGMCQVADGQLASGLPEVITVRSLDRDQKANRYPVAVRASMNNSETLYAGLRVVINGLPRYETTRHPMAPGQTWHAGHINVEFMKFVPEKKGK